MTAPFTIAIDGPAASGKGTIARALAAQFGFAHLDTGLLYRAVGAATLQGVPAIEAAQTLLPEALEDPALRTAAVAQAASKVAAITEVRAALLTFQQAFARRAGGAVLDGRDIGTVICPQADVKLFVTADAETRARRRHAELRTRGNDITFEDVLRDVKERDARDMNRSDAPLRAASDAVLLDTTALSIADATHKAFMIVQAARAA